MIGPLFGSQIDETKQDKGWMGLKTRQHFVAFIGAGTKPEDARLVEMWQQAPEIIWWKYFYYKISDF